MDSEENQEPQLPASVGLMGLIKALNLKVPLPAVRSTISSGARKTTNISGIINEYYPKSYAPQGLFGNIKFAMRYEPVDLEVWQAVFESIDEKWLEKQIKNEPTGIYTRRVWYLYELLSGKILDVADVPRTGAVDLLNPKLHITGPGKYIQRQKINDNLLGNVWYCPLIRRTDKLTGLIDENLEAQAKTLVSNCDPIILARAVNYLYTKETKSSFAIEGETVSKDWAERFVAVLSHAAEFDTSSKEALIKLQNSIVDPRYADSDYREVQNYVGQTMMDYSEQIHYVCPKPEDVEDLMTGWMKFVDKINRSETNAVCAAAATAFGFVFIHPFEDGNGRIHRFLIHHILAKLSFTPPELLFPVSAVILRNAAVYSKVLEEFSSSILPFIDYDLNSDGTMNVHNNIAKLYRYWDATVFAEYLYECIKETIQKDLNEELGFLVMFDNAMKATKEIIDMPNQKASLLVRLILQNKGKLSKTKREKFAEITDEEISRIETAIANSTESDD
ncbi:MAG: Fic family protein [Pyrinomonadaceae bacterium]|nr:Fic family protein [Pyrinomonadaceae bacterium]